METRETWNVVYFFQRNAPVRSAHLIAVLSLCSRILGFLLGFVAEIERQRRLIDLTMGKEFTKRTFHYVYAGERFIINSVCDFLEPFFFRWIETLCKSLIRRLS
jgi:hypothetical protein